MQRMRLIYGLQDVLKTANVRFWKTSNARFVMRGLWSILNSEASFMSAAS
jgi:hypothetical protein